MMTDRHAGYVVTLTHNIREDDARDVVLALKQIKGVLDVEPIVSDAGLIVAERRARSELREKLYAFYSSLFDREIGAD